MPHEIISTCHMFTVAREDQCPSDIVNGTVEWEDVEFHFDRAVTREYALGWITEREGRIIKKGN